nr:MAG TPA: hypothetical protein [Caudoviricetes sp.]
MVNALATTLRPSTAQSQVARTRTATRVKPLAYLILAHSYLTF